MSAKSHIADEMTPAEQLASQRNLIALKMGQETAWIIDRAISALRRAEEAERKLAAARPTAEERELALDTLESLMCGPADIPWAERATKLAQAISRIKEATK